VPRQAAPTRPARGGTARRTSRIGSSLRRKTERRSLFDRYTAGRSPLLLWTSKEDNACHRLHRGGIGAIREGQVSGDGATLAEVLLAEGYRTAAITNGGFVVERYGFARGFDPFEVARETRDRSRGRKSMMRELLHRLEACLTRNTDQPHLRGAGHARRDPDKPRLSRGRAGARAPWSSRA